MTAVAFAEARAAVVREAYAHGVDLMEMFDAVYECPCHGSLDCMNRTWPMPVPDLMSTFKAAKEAAVERTIVPTFDQYPKPIGPRRRIGRPPGRKTALALVPPPAPVEPPVDPLDAALTKLDAEYERVFADQARLERTRLELQALEEQLLETTADLDRIATARDALAEVVNRPLATAV